MQRTLLPRETCFYFKQYSQCQLFWRKRHLTRVLWWLIIGDQVISCVACQCHGCIWVPESWLVLIPSSKSTAQLRSSHPFIGFNFRQPRIKTRHLTLAELSDTDSRSVKWADHSVNYVWKRGLIALHEFVHTTLAGKRALDLLCASLLFIWNCLRSLYAREWSVKLYYIWRNKVHYLHLKSGRISEL